MEIVVTRQEHLRLDLQVHLIAAAAGGVGRLGEQAEMDIEIVLLEDRVDAGHEAISTQPAVAELRHVIGDGVEASGQVGGLREPVGGHPIRQGIGAAFQGVDLAGELARQAVDGVDEAVDEGEPAVGALRQGQIVEAIQG